MSMLNYSVFICLMLLDILIASVSACELSICDHNSALVNVALGKPAAQISNYDLWWGREWGPDKGNDGNDDGNMGSDHCFHTSDEPSPWWEVDLEKLHCISQVNITNRADCCADRAQNVEISVAKEHGNWTVVASYEGEMGAFLSASFDPIEACQVRITLRDVNDYMHFCEVEVFGFD